MQTFWYRLTQVHLEELPLKHRDREEGGRERVTLSLVGSYRLTSGDQIQHGKTFGDGACRGSATQLYIAKMRARRLSSIAEFFLFRFTMQLSVCRQISWVRLEWIKNFQCLGHIQVSGLETCGCVLCQSFAHAADQPQQHDVTST